MNAFVILGCIFILQACGGETSNDTGLSNNTPIANAGADQSVYTGHVISLNGHLSTDSDGDPIAYRWNQTDGPSVTLSANNAVSPTFIAPGQACTLSFSLVVNDGHIDSTSDTVVIEVLTIVFNQAPIANAGQDQTVNGNSVVSLNGYSSVDSDGDELSYHWTQIGGTPIYLSSDSIATPSFTAPANGGSLVFSLVVNDGEENSNYDTVTILVNSIEVNSKPNAYAGPNQYVDTGSLVYLTGSGTDADSDDLTYNWSIIDSPKGSSISLSGITHANPTFTADLDGDYILGLVVNDGALDSAQDTTKVIARTNSAPEANAGPDQNVITGSIIYLTGSGTDADSDDLTYNWSIIDSPKGSAISLSDITHANPTFTADLDGDYILGLVVNDGVLDSALDTILINARTNKAPHANAGPDQNVNIGSTVYLSGSATDTENDDLSFLWIVIDSPNGSTLSLSDSTLSNPTFTADIEGDYILGLTVNDGVIDSNLDSITISATPFEPSYSILNDTGITFGGNYPNGNNATCIGETIEQQDCSHGRDYTHNDDSDGHAGFSYTKLDGNGKALVDQSLDYATQPWVCVRDNVTGLIWEVKTDDGSTHDKDNTYRWGGKTTQGSGFGIYYNDWNTLVDDSNTNSYCGFSNWRVPTRRELKSIVNHNDQNLHIDLDYFPNTATGLYYWASSPWAFSSVNAWNISFFGGGDTGSVERDSYSAVRLVRSGP